MFRNGNTNMGGFSRLYNQLYNPNQGGYGPNSNDKLILTKGLLDLMRSHTKYISELSLFEQYIIWRYTLGSGSVNKELIGIPNETNKVFWTYLFFKNYNYSLNNLDYPYNNYTHYFHYPEDFLKENERTKLNISNIIINMFIGSLQTIIKNSPIVKEEFIVYKVSTYYPDLPKLEDFNEKYVKQLPFNSTTYNPEFDFSYFIGDKDPCCFFKIIVTKGLHVLYVPKEYHAYSFEDEIILPYGITFSIYDHGIVKLNYVPKDKLKLDVIQRNPLYIGPVYENNKSNNRLIKSKNINIFYVKLFDFY